jgi:8-oxo-dGTP pyrophosphatase MutT (NUDIX family)
MQKDSAPEPSCGLAESRSVRHSIEVSAQDSHLTILPPPLVDLPEVWRPSQLRKMIGTEKVAAVCYRTGKRGIELLLVRTRGGSWTFPKGGVEPGLTRAQSAALEAFEEAGVHGRMEKASFARYIHRKKGEERRGDGQEVSVHAHLCEVLRLHSPKESDREPTWFSPEKAKRRLRQGRTRQCARELDQVVELAMVRILQSVAGSGRNEALRAVSLEAGSPGRTVDKVVLTVQARQWSYTRRDRFAAPSTRTAAPDVPARQRLLEGGHSQRDAAEVSGSRRPLALVPQVRRRNGAQRVEKE